MSKASFGTAVQLHPTEGPPQRLWNKSEVAYLTVQNLIKN